MHELSIVFDVIDKVEELAEQNHVKKVTGLTMELGEVSSVLPDYFRDCYDWAIKKTTYMTECHLDIVILKATSFCKDCHEIYDTMKYAKTCPKCHSENTYLLTGDEINIRDIKVVEETEEEK